MTPPKRLQKTTSIELEKAVENYIELLTSGDYNCDRASRFENEVFEKAVEMLYGPDIWHTFINPIINDQ